jgi:hypothetical protein
VSVAHRIAYAVSRTHPIWGAHEPQAEEPSVQERISVGARVATFGSSEAREALDAVAEAAMQFRAEARQFEALERRGEGQELVDARMAMDAARNACFDRLRSLETVVQRELVLEGAKAPDKK